MYIGGGIGRRIRMVHLASKEGRSSDKKLACEVQILTRLRHDRERLSGTEDKDVFTGDVLCGEKQRV